MRGVAVLLLIFLLDVAFAKTSIVLPSPTASGMETSAVLVLPEMASNKTQRLMISVEAFNAATNQLEIWFCNDILGSRESRDCLIGFDEGCLSAFMAFYSCHFARFGLSTAMPCE